MKRILSALLASLMLLGVAPAAIFAEGETSLTLSDSSHLLLDTEKGYVDKIDGTVTVADLKAEFASAITVKTGDAEKTDDKFVATDDTVSAGADSLKALIYGDVDRTGKINLSDVSGTMKHVARWNPDVNTDAADVDKSGAVNLLDASKLLKFIAGFEDISLGNVRLVFDNTKLNAPAEDKNLELFFSNLMDKTKQEDTKNSGYNSFKIKLAKNEAEGCHFIITAKENVEGLTAELSDFVHEYGEGTIVPRMNEIGYYGNALMINVLPKQNYDDSNFDYGNIPEVILPMSDSFEVEGGLAQHFTISVRTTKDTPAGMYKATLNIKNSAGEIVKTADVYLNVWDFTLPDAPYSASLFAGASFGNYGRKAYYDMMLEHDISSYTLPYEITDPEADAYMSDPRVTAFVIAGGVTGDNGELGTDMYGGSMNESPADTVANYNKVMSNPEWAKKGLFYYFDEPWGPHLDRIGPTYEYVTNLLGVDEIRNMAPLGGNDGYENEYCTNNMVDPVDYIDPYMNLWCPQSPAFHLWSEGGKWGLRKFYNKYGEFADRAKAFKEKGEEMWWYVCCSPEAPYANYFTWYQGVIVRLLSWQQFYNDVDGVLYYGIGVHWNQITKHKFEIYNGDGVLAFPGEKFGFEGPLESWRLLQIRDGIDDIDYLSMAEELVGNEAVIEVVKTVTSGMLKYTEDWQVLDAARDRIAKLILENQDK